MEKEMGTDTFATHTGEKVQIISGDFYLMRNKNGGVNVGIGSHSRREPATSTRSHNRAKKNTSTNGWGIAMLFELIFFSRPVVMVNRFVQRNWFELIFFGQLILWTTLVLNAGVKHGYNYEFYYQVYNYIQTETDVLGDWMYVKLGAIVLLMAGVYVLLKRIVPTVRLPAAWRRCLLRYQMIRLLNEVHYLRTHEMDPTDKITKLVEDFCNDACQTLNGHPDELRCLFKNLCATAQNPGKDPLELRGRNSFLPELIQRWQLPTMFQGRPTQSVESN